MMEIGPLSNQPAGERPERPDKPKQAGPPSDSAGGIEDRVEISDEARIRLAEMADRELRREALGPQPAATEASDADDKLDIVRRRIQTGYYDQPDVKKNIADKLIDDMDV
jgi:hypothetical protein